MKQFKINLYDKEYIITQNEDGTFNKPMDIENIKTNHTALKPAQEFFTLCRKPIEEKTITQNVMKYGTGGINIDGCRVDFKDENDKENAKPGSLNATGKNSLFGLKSGNEQNSLGRFPANVIFDEEAGKLLDEQSGNSKSSKSIWNGISGENSLEGWKRKSHINKIEGGFNDEGGASRYFKNIENNISDSCRFFYTPKVSKSERNAGMDDDKNFHPTLKPIKLMSYLIRLITPQGGLVLDCFNGSGSTGCAAMIEGMDYIGIDLDKEYCDISIKRIEYWKNGKNTSVE